MKTHYMLAIPILLGSINSRLLAQLPTVDSVFAVHGTLVSPNGAALDGYETERIIPLQDGQYLGVGSKWVNMGFWLEIRPTLMKYDLCGTPDTSFSNDGLAEITWISQGYLIPRRGVELADGSFFLFGTAGSSAYSSNRPCAMKVLANGQVDASFGTDGVLSYNFPDVFACGFGRDLIRLENDKLVGTASRSTNINGGSMGYSLFGYLPDGQPDPDFGANGEVHVASAEGSVNVQVHQVSDTTLLVVRGRLFGGGPDFIQLEFSAYDTTGVLQSSFGVGGVLADTTQFQASVGRWGFDSALDDQGRIVVFSRKDEQNLVVVRFLPDGSRDTGFGTGGVTYVPTLGATAAAVRLVMRDDGTMVGLASTANFGAQWFVLDADGALVPGSNAIVPLPGNQAVTDLLSAPNGRWLAQAQAGWPTYQQWHVRFSDDPVVMPHITLSGSDLVTTGSGVSFQWYLNGSAINGANGTSLTPAQNGDYTVEMTDDLGCTVMSPVFNLLTASVEEQSARSHTLVSSMVEEHLKLILNEVGSASFRIVTSSGQVISTGRVNTGLNTINVGELPTGAYILIVSDGNSSHTLRWMKM